MGSHVAYIISRLNTLTLPPMEFDLYIITCNFIYYVNIRHNVRLHLSCRAVACLKKLGLGGGGAQSNFPTHDHQNVINLVLI